MAAGRQTGAPAQPDQEVPQPRTEAASAWIAFRFTKWYPEQAKAAAHREAPDA